MSGAAKARAVRLVQHSHARENRAADAGMRAAQAIHVEGAHVTKRELARVRHYRDPKLVTEWWWGFAQEAVEIIEDRPSDESGLTPLGVAETGFAVGKLHAWLSPRPRRPHR